MKLSLALLALLGAPPQPPPVRLLAPLPGWTEASTAELVADVAGDARLDWLGWGWPLLPSPSGRIDVWLPLLRGWNDLAVTTRGKGKRETASTRVWREAAASQSDELLIIAGWPAGLARLDLRVIDPSGESCDASNRRTRMGGLRLRDDPEAPGPHVFVLPRAEAGEYHVSLLCGRLAPGVFVPVHAVALLFPGTPREERFDLSGVVGRCDVETDLGTVEVVGRLPGASQ